MSVLRLSVFSPVLIDGLGDRPSANTTGKRGEETVTKILESLKDMKKAMKCLLNLHDLLALQDGVMGTSHSGKLICATMDFVKSRYHKLRLWRNGYHFL